MVKTVRSKEINLSSKVDGNKRISLLLKNLIKKVKFKQTSFKSFKNKRLLLKKVEVKISIKVNYTLSTNCQKHFKS